MVKKIIKYELILIVLLATVNIYFQLMPLKDFIAEPAHAPPLGMKFIPYCSNGDLSSFTEKVGGEDVCLADHPGEKAKVGIFVMSILLLIIFPFLLMFALIVVRGLSRIRAKRLGNITKQ
ncbi:hypothetical protein [Spartinivicinus poritis]|uniref:Uncharacterized protein n=1 Tax=Spartinivicinus poritis TaxID=2994640 RepID=A0ABT5UHL8_9GAMM|nr:hypothetical protein [Spartinivicinus sp. A2-2]MDE1465892.1 hypothetical protein [Spartinivicinus sp. A2-2]